MGSKKQKPFHHINRFAKKPNLELLSILDILTKQMGVLNNINIIARTLSQLNDTNAFQKWSFSKCGCSTCRGSKIKPKHVYGDIVVLFLQKIVWGASCRPPGGPRVTPIL